MFSLSQLLLCGILWDLILTLLLCFRKNIEWWSAVIRVQNRWKRICRCHGHKGKKLFLLQWNFSFGTPLLKGHLHSWDAKFGLERCSHNLCICYLCWSSGERATFSGSQNMGLTAIQGTKKLLTTKSVDKFYCTVVTMTTALTTWTHSIAEIYYLIMFFVINYYFAAWNDDYSRFRSRIKEKYFVWTNLSPTSIQGTLSLVPRVSPE